MITTFRSLLVLAVPLMFTSTASAHGWWKHRMPMMQYPVAPMTYYPMAPMFPTVPMAAPFVGGSGMSFQMSMQGDATMLLVMAPLLRGLLDRIFPPPGSGMSESELRALLERLVRVSGGLGLLPPEVNLLLARLSALNASGMTEEKIREIMREEITKALKEDELRKEADQGRRKPGETSILRPARPAGSVRPEVRRVLDDVKATQQSWQNPPAVAFTPRRDTTRSLLAEIKATQDKWKSQATPPAAVPVTVSKGRN